MNVVRMVILLLKGEDLIDLWYSKSEGNRFVLVMGDANELI